MSPDLSAGAFLRRHQNPLGLGLRLVVLPILLVGLWRHSGVLLVCVTGIEVINLLFCPEREGPPRWLAGAIAREHAFLARPWGPGKIATVAVCVAGLAVVKLGLWFHVLPAAILGAGLVAMALVLAMRVGRIA